jgi:AraC-like DNA-binding protein
MAFVLSGVVEGLLQTGAALGLDRAALLASADIDEAALLDRDRTLPLSAQVAVGRAIVDARPGVNIALEMLRRLQPGAFGVLGYALASSESLAQALTTFVRYQGCLTDALRWGRPDAVTLTVEADPELAPLGHPVETAVGLWVALGRRLAGLEWRPRALSFRHTALGDPAEHAAFFGVAPVFGAARNALVLDAPTLALPVHGAELALRSPLLAVLADRSREPRDADVVSSLRAELRRRLPRGTADKPSVARAMGMSARTLARRLQEEGTRYAAVLDETRRSIALDLLDGPVAVYEVSFLLGYSEPSTFHRAFRRWTGESPEAWRRARRSARPQASSAKT